MLLYNLKVHLIDQFISTKSHVTQQSGSQFNQTFKLTILIIDSTQIFTQDTVAHNCQRDLHFIHEIITRGIQVKQSYRRNTNFFFVSFGDFSGDFTFCACSLLYFSISSGVFLDILIVP